MVDKEPSLCPVRTPPSPIRVKINLHTAVPDLQALIDYQDIFGGRWSGKNFEVLKYPHFTPYDANCQGKVIRHFITKCPLHNSGPSVHSLT